MHIIAGIFLLLCSLILPLTLDGTEGYIGENP